MGNRTSKDKSHTIEAVAKAAGVSTMTVSRVLRSTDRVAPDTRKRVQEAMQELGYVHNRLAGALASSHSAQVAIILSSIDNIVFAELLSGVTTALNGSGYQPVIGVSEYSRERELEIVRSMLEWRPAGFILTHPVHLEETRRMLLNASIPVIELMSLLESPLDMNLGLDHVAAGCAMAEHVLAKGYRQFGYLGANHEKDVSGALRFEGFCHTIGQHGGKMNQVVCVDEHSGIAMGRHNMHRVLESRDPIELVYFSNDAVAAGAMMYCMAQGISIPDKIALASFSGLEVASSMPLPITTTASPRYQMGKQGAEQILRRIRGEKFEFIVDAGYEIIAGKTS